MSEPTPELDVRMLVGFPRQPVLKVKRTDRVLLRNMLETTADPVMGLRISLALGVSPKLEWLAPTVLDQALNPVDIARHLDKLSSVKNLADAVSAIEVLKLRFRPDIATTALNSLRKFLIGSKSTKKKQQLPIVLTEETSLGVMRLAELLIPSLLSRQTKTKKNVPEQIAELLEAVVEGCTKSSVAAAALGLLALLEKHAGWEVMERAAVHTASEVIIGRPAALAITGLETGNLEDAKYLADKLPVFAPAESCFRDAISAMLEAKGPALPLSSRNWAQRYLSGIPEAEHETAPEAVTGDAPRERLALILINSWEARHEGNHSAHAFSVAEEVCRIGFEVNLVGEVGAEVGFDPDIHESSSNLKPGDKCRIVRPWIEWRSQQGIKILIRARVSKID